MRRIIFYFVLLALTVPTVTASPQLSQNKLSPALRLLRSLHNHLSDGMPASVRFAAAATEIGVTVRFVPPANPDEWAARGIRLKKMDGIYSGSGSIFAANMNWDEIDRWANHDDILMIACDWHPKIVPCLDLSAPEVGATEAWNMNGPAGFPITGEGQIIADFDTGIDVFHPSFFKITENRYDWLDVNQDGVFTPGVDAVDLDGNGSGSYGELLELQDGEIYDEAATFGGSMAVSNADGIYQPDWDWLYNDENDDGERNYGSDYGYNESDPCYGELLFHCDDVNGNNILDPGEELIQLGESKILAVMDDPEEPHLRGIDLIEATPDYNGHGTAVCGVLAGGEPGRSRFCGLAPDAELLVGYSGAASFAEYLPWVREMGCNILLYEFGGWVFLPLDGSTNEELLLDSEAALGVMQVAPSGNLNRGYKHCQLQLASGADVPIQFGVEEYNGMRPTAVYSTFLWREPSVQLSFSIEDPYGYAIDLIPTGAPQYFGNWMIFSFFSVSPRNTAEYDFYVYGTGGEDLVGTWTLTVHHPGGDDFELNGGISDDASSWEGGAEWIDYRSNDKTVTWPATADSAFVLGSYSTRGYEQYIGVGSGSIQPGEISLFSGRGKRIDEVSILSIAAPGNYDVYSARSIWGFPYTHGGYRQFSGTSAAGPHVAAAAALVWQADPELERIEVEHYLEDYALEDEWTGDTYNDTWGYGKVRVAELIHYLDVPLNDSKAVVPDKIEVTAYPNPFNPTTVISFQLPVASKVRLDVFDITGRNVEARRAVPYLPGSHSINFDASHLASGIYFYRIEAGDFSAVRKMVLMK